MSERQVVHIKPKREPEGTDISCGIFVLGLGAVLGLGCVLGLMFAGVSVELLEKGMVWLSVPWVAFWYLKCRKWHRTKIVFVNGRDANDTLPPPSA